MNVESLIEASETELVAYMQFMLKYKKSNNALYCFFEGKDDKKYYGSRIILISDKKYIDFTCNGKDNVKKVRDIIKTKQEYSDAMTAYFIDSDFDDFINDPDIYETPGYSVENFYTSKSALEKILVNEFELKEGHNDYDFCINKYITEQEKFHDDIHILNSWLCCQKDIRKRENLRHILKIDAVLSNYFNNKLVNTSLEYTYCLAELNKVETLKSLFLNAAEIEMTSLEDKVNQFKEIERQKKFRGKFELRFLSDFLFRLQNEICNKTSSLFTEKKQCNLRFEYVTTISMLSQYADTTDCLKQYILSRTKYTTIIQVNYTFYKNDLNDTLFNQCNNSF